MMMMMMIKKSKTWTVVNDPDRGKNLKMTLVISDAENVLESGEQCGGTVQDGSRKEDPRFGRPL